MRHGRYLDLLSTCFRVVRSILDKVSSQLRLAIVSEFSAKTVRPIAHMTGPGTFLTLVSYWM